MCAHACLLMCMCATRLYDEAIAWWGAMRAWHVEGPLEPFYILLAMVVIVTDAGWSQGKKPEPLQSALEGKAKAI